MDLDAGLFYYYEKQIYNVTGLVNDNVGIQPILLVRSYFERY